jgi:ACS family tartrate transporter-like MFS transporter
MSMTATGDKIAEDVVMRRVFWRLMPFLLAAYLICYIDRVNVGFASLQMNKAVGIDPKTYGLGAGIFFIGYFLLEVPSNLGLERFGASRWIARIMVSWGLLSAAFALVGGPVSFLVLRFLLGAAEAGFFPGVILYLIPTARTTDLFRSGMTPVVPANSLAENGHRMGPLV